MWRSEERVGKEWSVASVAVCCERCCSVQPAPAYSMYVAYCVTVNHWLAVS